MQVRVGAIAFSTSSAIAFKLDKYSDKKSTQKRISKIQYTKGWTKTHLALEMLRTQLLDDKSVRPGLPKYCFLNNVTISFYEKTTLVSVHCGNFSIRFWRQCVSLIRLNCRCCFPIVDLRQKKFLLRRGRSFLISNLVGSDNYGHFILKESCMLFVRNKTTVQCY